MFDTRGKYLYHYSSHYQNEYNQTVYIDGILEAKERINSHGEYMKIKPVITKKHAHHLAITNLSYIGRENE